MIQILRPNPTSQHEESNGNVPTELREKSPSRIGKKPIWMRVL